MPQKYDISKFLANYLYCRLVRYSEDFLEKNPHIPYNKYHVKFLQPEKESKQFVLCCANGKAGPCTNSRQYGSMFCHHHAKKKEKSINHHNNQELFLKLYGRANNTVTEGVDKIVEFIEMLVNYQHNRHHQKILKFTKRNRMNPIESLPVVSLNTDAFLQHFRIVREKRKDKNYVNNNKCLAVTKTGQQCGNNAYRHDYCSVHRAMSTVMRYEDYVKQKKTKDKSVSLTTSPQPCYQKWTVMKGIYTNNQMMFRLKDKLFTSNNKTVSQVSDYT